MQVLKTEKLQETFAQIDLTLSNIEVKGDSVQYLFNARGALKDLFVQIKDEESKKEDNLEQKGG